MLEAKQQRLAAEIARVKDELVRIENSKTDKRCGVYTPALLLHTRNIMLMLEVGKDAAARALAGE
jgi:hypothetical protein